MESTELKEYRIDDDGPNKGLLTLASGPEITAYCHAVMRDRLLPSGRVTYLPMTEYAHDGEIRRLLSREQVTIDIRRKLVDATYYTNSIPLTHRRAFGVDASVTCVPPNDLPRLATGFEHYTILGAGKTGMDACLWLLENGADPDRLRWIIPRDQWFVNRAKAQPGPEFFIDVFGSFVDARNDIASAENAIDLARRHERSGLWLRLDPAIEPVMFHGAHVSTGELAELRRINDVVRKGRVTGIEPDRVVLTSGTVRALTNSLYIDCTASALQAKPLVPVFQPGKIVIQAIRFPQIPFSGALIALLETLDLDDDARNGFAAPIPVFKTIDDYVAALAPDFQNRARMAQHPELRQWARQSRLDGFSRIASMVRPDETEKVALLARVKAATIAANENLPRLLRSLHR